MTARQNDKQMKPCQVVALLILSTILNGCATQQADGSSSIEHLGELGFQTISEFLPGAYSNFAQNHDTGPDNPVTDINIRQLKTSGEPVFLFASELRDLGSSNHDVYWLKLNPTTHQAEFHFTRLTEEELSLPMQDTLTMAWQRVLPGCVISMKRAGEQFTGHTNPETCRFEHPLQGETRLLRHLTIGAGSLSIDTELETAGDVAEPDMQLLELQKHRDFTGWTSIRINAGQQQNEPGEWQLSQVFNTRDDGRVSQLYNQQMESMGFGLQLARLHRFDGESPYYLLSVINLANGQIQAYKWLEPGSERLNFNLDWFQTSLELLDLQNQ